MDELLLPFFLHCVAYDISLVSATQDLGLFFTGLFDEKFRILLFELFTEILRYIALLAGFGISSADRENHARENE